MRKGRAIRNPNGLAWFQVSQICAMARASEFEPSDTYIYINGTQLTVRESPEEVMDLIRIATT